MQSTISTIAAEAAGSAGRTAVSFTGGKDCVLAMHLFGADKQFSVAAADTVHQRRVPWTAADTEAARAAMSLLVTFAPPDANFKAHPLPIIRLQAKALGLPHMVCVIDPHHAADSYKQQIQQLHQQQGITQLVTGDILDIAGGFMQKAVHGTGVDLVMPLWQQPRQLILGSLLDLSIQAVISCVDTAKYGLQSSCHLPTYPANTPVPADGNSGIDPSASCKAAVASIAQQGDVAAASVQAPNRPECSTSSCPPFDATTLLLGHTISPELVQGPLSMAERLFGCDMCGEYGEYHTLVTAAPMFVQVLHLSVSTVATCPTSPHSYILWNPVES